MNDLTLRFQLGPFPVAIDPWFWLITLMAGQRMPATLLLAWTGVVFVSVLVHELGHALACRQFGARAEIRLYGLGGLTSHGWLRTRRERIVVSLAGPGAGFALGGLVYVIAAAIPSASPLAAWTNDQMLWVNLGWGAVNLLPVPPLDGGHVLEEVLGGRGATRAAWIGAAVGGAVALYGAMTGWTFLLILFGYLAVINAQRAQA